MDGYTTLSEAMEHYCSAPWCTLEADHDICCVERATCDTLLSLPEGWSLKNQAYDIMCDGNTCSVEMDLETCAEHQATRKAGAKKRRRRLSRRAAGASRPAAA